MRPKVPGDKEQSSEGDGPPHGQPPAVQHCKIVVDLNLGRVWDANLYEKTYYMLRGTVGQDIYRGADDRKRSWGHDRQLS